MLLLIPILLPVISGTILLIKKWKKKLWRRPRFVLLSSLINSAVVLGFLIAQYQEALELTIAGPVTFWLEADGLGTVFAACMALMIPAILCFSFRPADDTVPESERTESGRMESQSTRPESQKNVKAKREEKEKNGGAKKDKKDKTVVFAESESRRKNRFLSALLNYQFATVLGIAFSKNAATAGFFFLLMILLTAVFACVAHGSERSEKWNRIFAGVGAAAVLLVLIVAVFGGNGAVFYFDGFLTGEISDTLLQLLYLLCFCGCSVRALAGPIFAGRQKKDSSGSGINSEKTQRKNGKEIETGMTDRQKKNNETVRSKTEQIQEHEEAGLNIGTENLLVDMVFLYLLLRMTFSVFGVSLLRGTWVQVVVMLLSDVGVCAHAVLAFREKDPGKKTAYLSGAAFSLTLSGICVMTSHGYTAAVWMMISFAAAQMLLIFFTEIVKNKCGNLEEITPGLGRQMPVTFGCYVVALLSIGAVPPLAGFLGVWKLAKAFTRQGGLNYLSMAAMFVCLFLTVLSLYPLTIRAFFPKQEPVGKVKTEEASLWMLVPMVILAAAVIAVGIFSGTLGEYIYQIGLGLM